MESCIKDRRNGKEAVYKEQEVEEKSVDGVKRRASINGDSECDSSGLKG